MSRDIMHHLVPWLQKLIVTLIGAVLPTVGVIIAAGVLHPELFHSFTGWIVLCTPGALAAKTAYETFLMKSPFEKAIYCDDDTTDQSDKG